MSDEHLRLDYTPARWAYAVLIVVSLFAYHGSLDIGFVYDDHKVIVNNRLLRGPEALPDYVSPDYFRFSGDPKHYRPVATLSHWAIYQLAGLDPRAHHAASLLLHLANAVLLLALLARVIGRTGPALIGALWFALHPAISEAVLCATFRRDALVLLGLLLALTCARRGWIVAIAVAQVAAIGSKETAAVAPLLVPLLSTWLWGVSRRTAVAAGAATAAVTLVYLLLRLWLQARSLVIAAELPAPALTERLALALVHLRVYLQLLVVPWPLGIERLSTGLAGATSVVASMLAVAGLALAVPRDARARAAAVWIVLPLVPVLLFVHASTAERYLYVPAAGGALALALAVNALADRLPDRRWAVFAALPVLALSGRLLQHQVAIWGDPIRLWQQAADHFPESFRIHIGLADGLLRTGDPAGAERHVRRALVLYPDSDAALRGLVLVLAARGRSEEAARAQAELLARNPLDADAIALERDKLRR